MSSKIKSPLNKSNRIYIAGHTGMVGSAIHRRLKSDGHKNIITRTHTELDLTDQQAVRNFFNNEKIDYIILAAAKVGGIHANNTYRAEFIYQNLMIQNNVIHEAYKVGIQRLLFLGSSCIYPRHAPQPMKEEYLLTDPLEPTNEAYAIAKIAGIKLCESYNCQYGTKYRSVMPTNLYGPNDNYDLVSSHLMAALIRKFHLAKLAQKGDWGAIKNDETHFGPIPDDVLANLIAIAKSYGSSIPNSLNSLPAFNLELTVGAKAPLLLWGTGTPSREFLHVDDMADACLFIMNLSDDEYKKELSLSEPLNSPETKDIYSRSTNNDEIRPDKSLSFFNIGCGLDNTIKEYADIVSQIIGYNGKISFDSLKPDGMPKKLLDVSKLKRIGWEAQISLSAGIKKTYDQYLSSSI